MSAGETITVVTPILGRIQCAPGFAATTLYVTIVGEQPFAKTAQSENQHFCMVRTPSMGTSFMLVEYPHMNKVLKATNWRDESDSRASWKGGRLSGEWRQTTSRF